jgi:outer membrane protein assembly factor BamE
MMSGLRERPNIIMRKLLIYFIVCASLSLSACVNRVPMPQLIHRPDIQQGNVITQKMVNKLRPGMGKSQVRYLLGSPMLVDVFHQERWDYLYTNAPGDSNETERRHVSLYFEDNRLARLEGDFRPMEEKPESLITEEAAIPVPKTKRDRGFLMNMWEKIATDDEEQATEPTVQEKKDRALRTAPPIPEPVEESAPPPQVE